MAARTIVGIRTAPASSIGGIDTLTPLTDATDAKFDPFLLLAHHGPQILPPGNAGLPFDDHPHRGFETVTFVLDGALVHSDSTGERREVSRGGVQWMTAGSGIIHNEQVPAAFLENGGPIEILQLWVNLPASLKTTAPRYVGIQGEEVTAVTLGDEAGTLHLIAGHYEGATGPVTSLTDVFMSWINVAAGSYLSLPAPSGRTVLLYVVRGSIVTGERTAERGDVIAVSDDGDSVAIEATADAVLLFAHADPIGEPVAARGPFVMNTPAEVDAAFRDYRSGKFGAA